MLDTHAKRRGQLGAPGPARGRGSLIDGLGLIVLALGALVTLPGPARADVVTDWNQTMIQALQTAQTPPPPAARVGAIVQSSVFDAVNGIARRYTSVHVPPAAPAGASAAAAAAGAADEALVTLFPTQQATFDAQLASSLSQISASPQSISDGVAWGRAVADQIAAWRAGDGFATPPPPYTPSGLPGRWALTPGAPLTAPLFRQFATMIPFALKTASQFLPGPPPALTSERYTRDFNEVKAYGGSVGPTLRSAEQTQTAQFWQADNPTAMWDRVADDLGVLHGRSILHNARILALVDIAEADSAIAVWNGKNTYDTWRPVTAIQQADTDGNPQTAPEPMWLPLLTTPAFQEYPAGHPGLSSAAATVLASFYGNATPFTVTAAGMTGVQRSFTTFASAIRQVIDARVWGGIHFRTAGTVAADMGSAIARYVRQTQLRHVCRHP